MLSYFWPVQHRHLLQQLTRREIQAKFRNSWLGLGWSVITPIAMLLVYVLVFQSVFKARWPGVEQSASAFGLNLFSGLILFTWFSDVITRSPRLIADNPSMVTKVVFPLHLLSWVTLLSSSFQAMISFTVLIIGMVILGTPLTWSLLLLPVLLAIFVLVLLGFSWLLAGLGVYLPDSQHLVGMLITPLMFLSPVFYPVAMLPEWLQGVIIFNPLTLMIEAVRAAVLGGDWPNLYYLAAYAAAALGLAVLGALAFKKLRKGFADVL